MPRRLLFLTLAAGSALSLAACDAPSAGISDPTGEPIRVGATLSLTGSLSGDGQAVKDGYLFCQDWINATGGIPTGATRHPFEIVMADDHSRPSLSAQATERLITEDGMHFLLGPSSNSTTNQDAAIANRHHVPMVEGRGLTDSMFGQNYRYLFGVMTPGSRLLQSAIDMAMAHWQVPQTAAILFANDNASSEVATETRGYAQSRGLNVVAFVSYPGGTNDLRGALVAAAAGNADLVLEVGHPQDSIVTMQQARQMHLQPRLFAFTQGPESPDFVPILGSTANYVAGATQWSPAVRTPVNFFLTAKDYAARYQARFGHQPDARNAAATASCVALDAAIQRARSTDPRRVRDALAGLDLQTFFGPIHFNDQGLNDVKPAYVEQVLKGLPTLVWPNEAAQTFPAYPDPGWAGR